VEEWYRAQLKKAVPSLIAKWEPLMGVKVERCFVQRMKTKWGSCNAGTRSIRLNTELAKKPVQCLEYIIVHELAHLIERHHNDRFVSIMNKHLPQWRSHRQELNSAPLAHQTWSY
jgi:predicted metal-dependent hydrolase